MHLAAGVSVGQAVLLPQHSSSHTNNGLLKLALMIQTEELASAEGEDHALVVLLQLVVDLGRHQCGELAVRERFVLVESLTVMCQSMLLIAIS